MRFAIIYRNSSCLDRPLDLMHVYVYISGIELSWIYLVLAMTLNMSSLDPQVL